MTDAELDQLSINTIRTLSIDAVQAANSGLSLGLVGEVSAITLPRYGP